ncbi:MAG: hypothetical protein R2788_01315 [Saprospiraceae bacterium]
MAKSANVMGVPWFLSTIPDISIDRLATSYRWLGAVSKSNASSFTAFIRVMENGVEHVIRPPIWLGAFLSSATPCSDLARSVKVENGGSFGHQSINEPFDHLVVLANVPCIT